MLIDRACFERGCACYDDRTDKDPVEVVKREAEQEPVGWFGYSPAHDAWFHTNEGEDDSIPLYKYPPKRDWVGLTDEDRLSLCKQFPSSLTYNQIDAIEAKLKEKNT